MDFEFLKHDLVKKWITEFLKGTGSDAGGRSGKVLDTGNWDSGDPGIRDAGDPGMAESRHPGLRGSRRRRYRALAHAGVPTYMPRGQSGDRRYECEC